MRTRLVKKNFLDTTLKISRDDTFLYFPLTEGTELQLQHSSEFDPQWGWSIVEHEFSILTRETGDYKEYLKRIPEELHVLLPASFDVIGDLCVIKLKDELMSYDKDIGSAIVRSHPSINGVFREAGVHGKFRIRSIENIAGVTRTTTVHREYGVQFKIDIAKAYFSPRLAGERHRIAENIRTRAQRDTTDERVLDMFAGIGPYSIHIARSCPDIPISAIDLNPDAIEMLKENMKLNRVTNIKPIVADANHIVSMFEDMPPFTRMIMNLPHRSLDFLSAAGKLIRKGTIHIYTINPSSELQNYQDKIQNELEMSGRTVDKLRSMELKGYSPSEAVFVHDVIITE